MAPSRADVEPWLKAETVRLLATVESLRDRDLTQDSVLPGWSLAHLLTHLARNADALGNLLVWARTGVETPMYQSITQRTADINLGATRHGSRTRRVDDRTVSGPKSLQRRTIAGAPRLAVAASPNA